MADEDKIADEEIDDIQISIQDLQERILDELVFLEQINSIQHLLTKEVLLNAVFRYERYWLPLISESTEPVGSLAPPLDVHWIWHCHLLAPFDYEHDCVRITGHVPDHVIIPGDTIESCRESAKELWEEKYSEPFDLDLESNQMGANSWHRRSQCTYGLVEAAQRQRSFFYQVSLPHYKSKLFLKNAITRYRMFLALKKLKPDVFLVPCYDIDLVWHTHQLHHRIYKEDTIGCFGRMFNHDDTVTDRGPESKLTLSNQISLQESCGLNISVNILPSAGRCTEGIHLRDSSQ